MFTSCELGSVAIFHIGQISATLRKIKSIKQHSSVVNPTTRFQRAASFPGWRAAQRCSYYRSADVVVNRFCLARPDNGFLDGGRGENDLDLRPALLCPVCRFFPQPPKNKRLKWSVQG